MPSWLGQEKARLDRFRHLLATGIAWLKEHKLEGRVPWAAFEEKYEQELVFRQRSEVSLEEPDDNWMLYSDYRQQYGEPGSNGLGHTRTQFCNKDIVVLPGTGVGKLRRSTKFQADLQSKIASSASALTGPDQLQDMQKGLLSTMFDTPSTGLSLDALLGQSGSSSSGSQHQRWALGTAASAQSPHPKQAKQEPLDSSSTPAPSPAGANSDSDWFLGVNAPDRPVPQSAPAGRAVAAAPDEVETPSKRRKVGMTTASPKGQKTEQEGDTHTPKPPRKGGKGKGGRGRPKADRVVAANKLLGDLKAAPEGDATFFGAGRAATLRLMSRLHDDLKAASTAADDSATFSILNKHVKRMCVAMEVVKVYNTKGKDNPAFFDVMSAQLHFLKLEPACDDDLPPFFNFGLQALKSQQAEGQEFWKLVCKKSLRASGIPAEELDAKQQDIVSNKVLKIAKMATRDETLAALRKTFAFEDLDLSDKVGDYGEPVRVATAHLQAIANPKRQKHDKLAEAIGACRGPQALPIVSLLCDFPRGKLLVDSAEVQRDEQIDASSWVTEWSQLLGLAKTRTSHVDFSSLTSEEFTVAISEIVACNKHIAKGKPNEQAQESIKTTMDALATCVAALVGMNTVLSSRELIRTCRGQGDSACQQVEML